MIRTSVLLLVAAMGAALQTGCCCYRPLLSRGCHPFWGVGIGSVAPAVPVAPVAPIAQVPPVGPVAPAPIFSGVHVPNYASPIGGPDCPGCGGYSSAAPVRLGPYGLPPHTSEPLAQAPAPMPAHLNNASPGFTAFPQGFNPELAGLPVYPAGKPMINSVAPSASPAPPTAPNPPGSTPLPAPMPAKEDRK